MTLFLEDEFQTGIGIGCRQLTWYPCLKKKTFTGICFSVPILNWKKKTIKKSQYLLQEKNMWMIWNHSHIFGNTFVSKNMIWKWIIWMIWKHFCYYCLRGPYLVVIRFLSFFLIVIKNCYGIGINVWKFEASTMKIVPLTSFEVHLSSGQWLLRAFIKEITSDNKLMNLFDIGLFRIVWGISKGTCGNYHEIWKK